MLIQKIMFTAKPPKVEAKGVPPPIPRLLSVRSGIRLMDVTSRCVAINIAALFVTPPPTEVATAQARSLSPTSIPRHFGQTLPGDDIYSKTEIHALTSQETVDSSHYNNQSLTLHHLTTPTAKVSLNISSNLPYSS